MRTRAATLIRATGQDAAMDSATNAQPPDVDALMAEVQRRVAEKKASGLYSVDALAEPAGNTGVEPYNAVDLAEVARLVDVMPNFQLARSTKRGVGGLVSKLKSLLSRATSQPLIGMGDQQSRFNATLLSYVSELAQEVAVLRAQVDDLRSDRGNGRT